MFEKLSFPFVCVLAVSVVAGGCGVPQEGEDPAAEGESIGATAQEKPGEEVGQVEQGLTCDYNALSSMKYVTGLGWNPGCTGSYGYFYRVREILYKKYRPNSYCALNTALGGGTSWNGCSVNVPPYIVADYNYSVCGQIPRNSCTGF
jgi:hypothetical protein